jgi:uncharacterized delta-60 repeat protein
MRVHVRRLAPRRRLFGSVGLALAATLLLALPALAAAGDLDATFDGDGKVITPLDHASWLNQLAIQPNGKIIGAGFDGLEQGQNFAVTRYNTDGSLDATWGAEGTGIVTTNFEGGKDFARAVVLQADGKVILGGQASYDFGLARYDSDGILDDGFGAGGLVMTDVYGEDAIRGLAIRPSDGKIVAAGYSGQTGFRDFALARYLPNGTLDTTFGANGTVRTDFGAEDQARGVVLIPETEKILVVGFTQIEVGIQDIILAQYKPNGRLDRSFGVNGKVYTDLGAGDVARAVVLQPDGKIVVGGYTGDGGGLAGPDGGDEKNVGDFAVLRYKRNGTLDPNFGTGGYTITNIAEGDHARGVALQANGKILLGGNAKLGTEDNFCVVRYNVDGSLDTSFGSGGIVVTDMGTPGDGARDVKVQADGRILLGGIVSRTGGGYNFALARYMAF